MVVAPHKVKPELAADLISRDLGWTMGVYPRIKVDAGLDQLGRIILSVPRSPGGQICFGGNVRIRRSDALALAHKLLELAK